MTARLKSLSLALAGAVPAVLMVGVGGFDLAAVKLPAAIGVGSQGSYVLHVQFEDTLNLQRGAKVYLDGSPVGDLVDLHLEDGDGSDGNGVRAGYVVADLRIRDTVRLPAATTAELRQATPMGDVGIVLTTPADDPGPLLGPGATIPRTQAAKAPQVEDILAGLATAMNGGIVTNFQQIVQQVNSALPADVDRTAQIAEAVGRNLDDVGNDLDALDNLLDGMGALVATVQDNDRLVAELLSDSGTEHTVAVVSSVVQLIVVLSRLGPVSREAIWLAPMVQATEGLAQAVLPVLFAGRPIDTGVPSNLARLETLIRTQVMPFVTGGGGVDLARVTISPPGRAEAVTHDRTSRIIDTLRMIGVVR